RDRLRARLRGAVPKSPVRRRPAPEPDSRRRLTTGRYRAGWLVPCLQSLRESLLPQRALPAHRDRGPRVARDPDAVGARAQDREGDALAGRGPDQYPAELYRGGGLQPEQARAHAHDDRQQEDRRPLPGRPGGAAPPGRARRGSGEEPEPEVRLQGDRLLGLVVDPHRPPAVRAPLRVLDLPHEPGPGRRLEGDELRQEPSEAD